jgi:tripartite-type tricarboxylate transporter receptor subunit TctC
VQLAKPLATLGLLMLAAGAALAQSYPVKPIRVILPQGPGGGSDLVARLMSPEIEKRLGQPFVIENRPGGNDSIAPDAVSKAQPDGYTIGVISSSFSINQTSVGIRLPFDSQKDFVPIAPMVRIPMVVLVNTAVGVNDLKSLVTLSQANPGKFNYGSAGPNTFGGMATEWLIRTSGADFTGVTYGGAGILQGLASGDLQLVFGGLAAATPTVQSGKAKIIAVTSAQRMARLPDIPAVAETYPGFEVVIFYGFVAPAGTPPEIVTKLNAAIGETITAMTPKLLEMGNEPMRMSPADFKAYLAKDLATWTKVVDVVKK